MRSVPPARPGGAGLEDRKLASGTTFGDQPSDGTHLHQLIGQHGDEQMPVGAMLRLVIDRT